MLDIYTLEYYCCWIAQSCPTLCDPMNYNKPGLPFPHHLPKFAQVHVHCISDAIQPSHPLMPSSPSSLNLSQLQGLFQWVGCSHQVTKIQELQPQHRSFQWIFRVVSLKIDWFDLPAAQGTLKESSTTIQRHLFFVALPSLWSSSHNCKWPLGRP